MKKTLHLFITLLCLLTLLVSAATCVRAAQPQQSSCDHCPKQSPLNQHAPCCCSVQQQQQEAVASTDVPPLLQFHAVVVFASDQISSPRNAPVIRWTSPPPPLHTPLRI